MSVVWGRENDESDAGICQSLLEAGVADDSHEATASSRTAGSRATTPCNFSNGCRRIKRTVERPACQAITHDNRFEHGVTSLLILNSCPGRYLMASLNVSDGPVSSIMIGFRDLDQIRRSVAVLLRTVE